MILIGNYIYVKKPYISSSLIVGDIYDIYDKTSSIFIPPINFNTIKIYLQSPYYYLDIFYK